MTHIWSPGTKICQGAFTGQAVSGLRGDASEFRQNEIPLEACEIISCNFKYPEWSGLILTSMLSYGTRKISIVTSITNTHCLGHFPIELISFTGQEDGHWCFYLFRKMFDHVLITQLWGALLDKGLQIRLIIPYYLVMYIILSYSIQDSERDTTDHTNMCSLWITEGQWNIQYLHQKLFPNQLLH